MTEMTGRALPTGLCWCGCGAEVGRRTFFARGHDKIAEGALIAARYSGEVAQMLLEHGFTPTPEASVTAAAVASGEWVRCSTCGYTGAPSSMRVHERRAGHSAS